MNSDLIISNHNEVYLHVQCNDGIAYELRDAFTFMVPGSQFTPQFRAKLWDGKIRIFDVRKRQIYRGLLDQVIQFANDRNYTHSYPEVYESEFSLSEATQFINTLNLTLEPRDYQIEALVSAVRSNRRVFLAATSAGKSMMIYLIMRYYKKKTLLIVPTTSLVYQMSTDFKSYGYEDDCHLIMAGREKDSNCLFTISTWQSIFNQPKQWFDQFDVVVGDECHTMKAASLTKIMCNLTKCKYRFGFTGTLDGTKTNTTIISGLFGPVKKIISTKELMDNKQIADFKIKCIVLKHSEIQCKAAKNYTYSQEIEYLILNEHRNNFISNLGIYLNGNTLILFKYVEKHGKILYEMINSMKDNDRKIFFIYGKTDAEVREEIRGIVETESNAIIVASYAVYSTGINIKNLHNIIFASPSKSRIRNLQSIGRGLRLSDTKKSAVLFDIADDLRYKKSVNYTLNHYMERIRLYSEEKFQFKIYKIDFSQNQRVD